MVKESLFPYSVSIVAASSPRSSTLVCIKLKGMKSRSLLPNPVAPCFLEKPQNCSAILMNPSLCRSPPLDIKVSEPSGYLLTFLYFARKCQDVWFEFHSKGGYHLQLSCSYLLPQFKEEIEQGGLVTSPTVKSSSSAQGPRAVVRVRCTGGCVGCAMLPFVGLDPEAY